MNFFTMETTPVMYKTAVSQPNSQNVYQEFHERKYVYNTPKYVHSNFKNSFKKLYNNQHNRTGHH